MHDLGLFNVLHDYTITCYIYSLTMQVSIISKTYTQLKFIILLCILNNAFLLKRRISLLVVMTVLAVSVCGVGGAAYQERDK